MDLSILDALAEVAEARGKLRLEERKAERRRWALICGELFSIRMDGRSLRAKESARNMSLSIWLNRLTGAVENNDERTLGLIAEQLTKIEIAAVILRSKGYGCHGQAIDIAIRDVPAKN